MIRFRVALSFCILGLVSAAPIHAQSTTCIGDCSGSKVVVVGNIITCVNIDLQYTPLSMCPACSSNGIDVGIADLVSAVNNLLYGCNGGPTPLPTATGGETPTAAPTPTPTTPSATIRVFTIDTLVAILATDDIAGSGVFNDNLLGHANVAMTMSSGPLTLALGPQDANGVAPLSLQKDVSISADVPANASCICFKFMAAGSTGSISCKGGTAYDTVVTQNTDSLTDTAWTIETGQGDPA